MGRVKHQGLVDLFGGWHYSSMQGFGFTHFAHGVGDLE
jgi:hypothetical protein